MVLEYDRLYLLLLTLFLINNNHVFVSDCVHLQLYRDSKERYKQSQTKASLSLENFLGIQTGKEINLLGSSSTFLETYMVKTSWMVSL